MSVWLLVEGSSEKVSGRLFQSNSFTTPIVALYGSLGCIALTNKLPIELTCSPVTSAPLGTIIIRVKSFGVGGSGSSTGSPAEFSAPGVGCSESTHSPLLPEDIFETPFPA